MAAKKNITRTIIVTVCLVLGLAITSSAQTEFINWTSQSDVQQLRVVDDSLFCLTSGGLLIVTDPTQPGRILINSDGLGTTDLRDLIVDSDNQKWIASYGRLVKFNYAASRQYLFRDNDDELITLNCLVDDGDYLWVGTDIGLVLFSKSLFGGQIQDSYTLFGDLNPSPAILDITIDGDSLWIATAAGLAVGNRSNPALLKSPSSWTVYGVGEYPVLASDTVRSVVVVDGEVYVSTPRGLFRMNQTLPISFEPIAIGTSLTYVSLEMVNDSLFYHYRGDASGMGVVSGTTATPLAVSGLTGYPRTSTGLNSIRWVAASEGGLLFDSSGTFVNYPYTGLPGNNVSDITVNANGLITAAFTEKSPAQFDGARWTTREFEPRQWSAILTTDLMIDSAGNTWGGSRGNSLWFMGADTMFQFRKENTTLIGNSDRPPFGEDFIYITDLANDGRYLFASCYRAVNNYPIAIADMENIFDYSGWDSLGAADSILDIFVISMDYSRQHLAIGTETNGAYLYYLGPNPFDHSDDSVVHYRETFPYFLLSDDVTVVRFDPDGNLWVGTNLGLNWLDPGIERFVPINLPAGIGPEITDIEFDGRGNVWVGSKTGLARLNLLRDETASFTSLNSDLLSDNIQCITFDHFTGRLFIGTDAGISYLPSEFGTPTNDITEVVAFPNPFVISNGSENLNFNFARPASMRLFTAAGELVLERTLTSDGWDGRNANGTEVASGVYLFLLTDEEGNVGRGKILLVRQ